MVENFKDIPFGETKTNEDLDALMREKLGIGFSECQEALCKSVLERAEELAEDLPNVAPYNDYDKFIEDKDDVVKFLREEVSKPENWKIQFMEVRKETDQLMELCFFNEAVDDGDVVKGFVFVGLSGKIRHAFAQVNS